MTTVRSHFTHLASSLAVAVLFAPCARADTPRAAVDSRPPSVLEEALAAYACDPQSSKPLDAARYQCVDEQIATLRVDFGYDLGRLSPGDRQTIDGHCARYRAAPGREGYVPCVSRELVALRARRTPRDAAGAPAAPDLLGVTAASMAPQRLGWLSTSVPLSVSLFAALAAAGLATGQRIKAARHRCKSCGAKMSPPGDLCAECRKRAAEALRQAAAERADRDREEEEERARREEEQQQRAREDELARLQHEHEERLREREKEQRKREEEERDAAATRAGASDQSDDDIFDPYTVLGIPWGASGDKLAAAYEQARAKYDPELVTHLGEEVQAHYRMKAEAVERAYQMLTAR